MLVLHREVLRPTDIPNGGLAVIQLEQAQSGVLASGLHSAVLRVYDKPC